MPSTGQSQTCKHLVWGTDGITGRSKRFPLSLRDIACTRAHGLGSRARLDFSSHSPSQDLLFGAQTKPQTMAALDEKRLS